MSSEQWTAVDHYINDLLVPADSTLEQTLAANTAAGLPAIDVSPSQGKLLHLLARLQRARRILEIGTLGGYSTIWLARALPADGLLVTLEANPKHAEVARENIQRAGLGGLVDLRVGAALETLPRLAEEGGVFDLIFIDADKANNPGYVRWALQLARAGTLIVVDNVVRDGAILDQSSSDPDIQGTQRMFEFLAAEPGVLATAIQTVGTKGYDGFAFALVTSD